MSDLQARFEQATQDVKGLSERPDNDTLLRLYAFYKQGSEGDVSGPKPGFFDFVGTAKYEGSVNLILIVGFIFIADQHMPPDHNRRARPDPNDARSI